MKLFLRLLSYILSILFGFMLALLLALHFLGGTSKLDQIQNLIASRFIGDYNEEKIIDAAADAMVGALGDRWSYYLSAEEYLSYEEQSENAYVGIGITIARDSENKGFLVQQVDPNGSALEAGILCGDIIISAENQSTAEMDVDTLRSIVRGVEGTSVSLTILRDDAELPFIVVRKRILTPVATASMLDDDIGMITIENFDSRCAEESIAAIQDLLSRGASALVFDVRNNPGGYADELVKLLDYILPEGDLFRTVDYSGKESIDRSDSSCLQLPIAVLCNGDSYSAAEFFAAAIQDYNAGTIIGTQTCGKGYFQYVYNLSDGSAVGLSVGKYFTPAGNTLIGSGVIPDIVVELDETTNYAVWAGTLSPDEDPQIQTAVEILHNTLLQEAS